MEDNSENRSVLIIDDEPAAVLGLSEVFRSHNVQVITATRLETAEQELNRGRFDLVIADVHLRGILGNAGLELLSYIKHHWPQTRVMIMTAFCTPEMRQDAFERGADYFYEKPFDVFEVRKILMGSGSGA